VTSSSGRLSVPAAELDLEHTLDCGQTFRWRRDAAGGWRGVVDRRVYRLTRLDPDTVGFEAWPGGDEAGQALAAYLRLDVDLPALQADLRGRDARLGAAIDAFPGLRVLRQPALETLLTFVCSPASNITRITRSIDALARLYGQPIATIEGVGYHRFPSLSRLAETAPGELASTTGLGFRGRGLRAVAAALLERSPDWVEGLAAVDYELARRELMALPSVGPKIADCACLFGLGHDAAVPVDTHVWQLARELFPDEIATRTLTPATYDGVRAAYLARCGDRAGWAQQYLYHGQRVARGRPMPSEVRLSVEVRSSGA
jgi:N-glycosylase/DNA lyase